MPGFWELPMNDSNYELELECVDNVLFANYPHCREGLEAALQRIEIAKTNNNNFVSAKITSSRDGLVFDSILDQYRSSDSTDFDIAFGN